MGVGCGGVEEWGGLGGGAARSGASVLVRGWGADVGGGSADAGSVRFEG
jgi:hypothetical protein